MKGVIGCCMVLACLELSTLSAHANPIFDLFGKEPAAPCKAAGCPDDYCPKPPPIVGCPNRFTDKDDYCAKPAPAAPAPVHLGCQDDYRAKGGLIRAIIGSGPSYQCGPQQLSPPVVECGNKPTQSVEGGIPRVEPK